MLDLVPLRDSIFPLHLMSSILCGFPPNRPKTGIEVIRYCSSDARRAFPVDSRTARTSRVLESKLAMYSIDDIATNCVIVWYCILPAKGANDIFSSRRSPLNLSRITFGKACCVESSAID
jgi:hypothetical protein